MKHALVVPAQCWKYRQEQPDERKKLQAQQSEKEEVKLLLLATDMNPHVGNSKDSIQALTYGFSKVTAYKIH